MIPLPGDPRKSTDPLTFLVGKLNENFPAIGSMGIYNRRRIADSSSWSQHSWGNAVDITSPTWMEKPPLYATEAEANHPQYASHMAYLDEVYDLIVRHTLPWGVRNNLWRRHMHYNHIHVDMNPKRYGTPPVLSEPYNPPEESMKKGDEGLRVVRVQEQLMSLGYPLPQFGADGDFGDETELAVKEFQIDRNLPVDGELHPTDMGLLFRVVVTSHVDKKARVQAARAHSRLNALKEAL
jgi:hypothetical protein